jgi:rare lipoprotein A
MSAVRAWLLLVLLTLPPDARSLASRAPQRVATARPALTGIASWYGWRHNGRLMANGQPFKPLGMTAASILLPLGTRVRVTNLDNGRFCDLTITDRGPYVRGRLIDVSLGAAKQLRMVDSGLTTVTIELLPATGN